MKIKHQIIFLIFLIFNLNSVAQNKPSYPEPKNGFKRVDLMLPRIENEKDFKIEVRFGRVIPLTECEDGSFTFKLDNLKTMYGIANTTRFPYYALENSNGDINTGKRSGCKGSDIRVDKKIVSDQNIFIEYQSYYVRPFYIPESWTIEYRIWAASNYISIEE